MKTVVQLSDTEVSVDGIVYRMVQKEPEVKKFVPFKGQLVYVSDSKGYQKRIRQFIKMEGNLYVCRSEIVNSLNTCTWNICEPIPLLVQFEPWENREGYNGKANVLFSDGQIDVYNNLSNVAWHDEFPIGFKKLDN